MNRKDFIKNGLLGTAIFSTTNGLSNVVENKIDELKELKILGFNHLPNTNSKIMANTILHKAETRGTANHGWLKANFSFSFANYYNPERMHFGVLRVMNDDYIAAGMGFGTHPHDNMEIITIPLEGALEHKDSMGNGAIIQNGDIQCMSAGTGIMHSEFNPNKDKQANTLQIWVFPNKRDVKPRYDQLTYSKLYKQNELLQILSPSADDEGVWIHQNAWFFLGKFDENHTTSYSIKEKENGVYVFVIKGSIEIDGQELKPRDGYGVWDASKISIKALSKDAEILLMDVPMSV